MTAATRTPRPLTITSAAYLKAAAAYDANQGDPSKLTLPQLRAIAQVDFEYSPEAAKAATRAELEALWTEM